MPHLSAFLRLSWPFQQKREKRTQGDEGENHGIQCRPCPIAYFGTNGSSALKFGHAPVMARK